MSDERNSPSHRPKRVIVRVNSPDFSPEDESRIRRRFAEIDRFYQTLHTLTPRTFITPLIIVANIAIFVWMLASGVHAMRPLTEDLVRWGANVGPLTLSGEWWRLFTCMFLHIGLIHLAFNMWVLWDLGHLVERMTGNIGFLLLYVVSGLIGSLASVVWNHNVISAGASGAVFGVFGAFLAYIFLRKDTIPREILVELRNSGLVFLFYNLVIGFSVKGIDMAAHLGGLGGGLLCGLILSQPITLESRQARPLRNLLLLVFGVVAVVGTYASLPREGMRYQSVYSQFSLAESRIIRQYNRYILLVEKKRLNNNAFADRLEKKLLPAWRILRKRFEAFPITDVPAKKRPQATSIRRYLALREANWLLQIRLLRSKPIPPPQGQTSTRPTSLPMTKDADLALLISQFNAQRKQIEEIIQSLKTKY